MNQSIKFIYLLFFTIFISFTSCEVEEDNDIATPKAVIPVTPNDTRISNVISKNTQLTNLSIKTVDKDNIPLSSTIIRINDQVFTTNIDGYILIENILLNEDYNCIKASKDNYEEAIKTITPSANGITSIELTLLNDITEQTFSATTGGLMTFGDVTVNFPANAIIDANKTPYSGTVTMNLIYHDPSADNFLSSQPGTLVGLTDEDDLTALISEGMITVDLSDDSGKKLNLADNKSASITMPATANSPAEIDLWHLNEAYGIWVETGKAIKNGDKYEFTVDHFSSYNLDWKVDPINMITLIVKDQNDLPLAKQKINVLIDNNNRLLAFTDNMGEVKITNTPKGSYTIKVLTNCSSFESNEINISGEDDYTFNVMTNPSIERNVNYTGKLYYCNNQLATNKAFNIRYTGLGVDEYLTGYSNNQGQFSINSILCNTASGIYEAEVTVVDNEIVKKNKFDIDLTYNTLDFDINTCGQIIALDDNSIISIPDANLRQALTDTLSLATNTPITFAMAKSFSGLNLSYRNISSIIGLEYFTSLQYLDLRNNLIADITPLIQLENLTDLILNENKISTLPPLEKMKKLDRLYVRKNTLNSISGIQYATALQVFTAPDNNISDLTPLEGLTTLESLNLRHNKISNINPLANLTNLNNLTLDNNFNQNNGNNIIDIHPLSNLTNLSKLNLGGNPNLTQIKIDQLKIDLPNTTINFY